MYSFSYLEPVCCSMSSSNCCFLTCIKFSQEAIRWSGIPISFRIFLFIVIHTVKGFGIVNKAEIDAFLELSYFFDDPSDVGDLISGCSAFSKIKFLWSCRFCQGVFGMGTKEELALSTKMEFSQNQVVNFLVVRFPLCVKTK